MQATGSEERPYRAFIFDMDGVILDSEPLHERAALSALSALGIDLPPHVFLAFKGQPAIRFFEHVATHYAEGRYNPPLLLAEKQARYQSLWREMELIPGVRAFIDVAARHGALAVTTSGTRHNLQRALETFSLGLLFDVTITADDIFHGKPHPEPYQKTVAALGVPPEACLVIEDAPHGVRSALGAGCDVAAITTSFPREELAVLNPTYVVDTFEDLAASLQLA